MRLIVDRIEGNYAVCEKDDMTVINVPLTDLPQDIHEGSILAYVDGGYIIDKDAETERRAKLFALQNSIFNE